MQPSDIMIHSVLGVHALERSKCDDMYAGEARAEVLCPGLYSHVINKVNLRKYLSCLLNMRIDECALNVDYSMRSADDN